MDSGELEQRVTALEGEVRDLNARVRGSANDAAAARVLAGAADRDVSEFRAEIRDFRQETRAEFVAMRRATAASFNAMRQDFVDLRTHVDQGFEKVDRGFVEIRGRLDATAAGQQQIVDLLQTILSEGNAG